MLKITITDHREKEYHEFSTEKEALNLLRKLIDAAINCEKDFLDDMDGDDPGAMQRIEELEGLNRNNIYVLECNVGLILGEYAEVEIEEYDYYITDLLKKLGLSYDKSTMSKSIYVENQEGLLIRISDHKESGSGSWMYRTPDINLVYKDGIINNSDINKYFNVNLEYERILL